MKRDSTKKSNLLLDGYTRYTTYCINIYTNWIWFRCRVRSVAQSQFQVE